MPTVIDLAQPATFSDLFEIQSHIIQQIKIYKNIYHFLEGDGNQPIAQKYLDDQRALLSSINLLIDQLTAQD